MQMKILFVLLAMICFYPSKSFCSNWIEIDKSSSGVFYIEKDSVKKNGDSVLVFTKNEFSKEESNKLKQKGKFAVHPQNSVTLQEINCRSSKIRTVSGAIYGRDGSVLHEYEATGFAYKTIMPDTIGALMEYMFCK